ncbi:hypothetical protein GCM10019059_30390 [Camelimonas fluminis]|nr:hypothetical protein GCM10019059_30390 [Camelimonas fluminis]
MVRNAKDRVGIAAHERRKLAEFFVAPVAKSRAHQTFAGFIDTVRHGAPPVREDDLPNAPVVLIHLPFDKAEFDKAADLPRNGCVITAIPVSKLNDPDRAKLSNQDQEGKQRAVEGNAGGPHHECVALRPVHDRHNIQNSFMKLA